MSNSAPFTITMIDPAAATPLSTAAAGLSAGEQVAFGVGPSWQFSDSVSWQTASLYYSPTFKIAQVGGKVASINPYEHYVYNETTNSWGLNTISRTASGHWWSHAFDPVTGDYYTFLHSGEYNLYHYRRSLGTWTTYSVSTALTSPGGYTGVSTNGMAWHPNLYGSGDGGIILKGPANIICARRSGDFSSWTTLLGPLNSLGQGGQGGGGGGDGPYVSSADIVWIGAGSTSQGGVPRGVTVTAGSGGTPGAAVTRPLPPTMVFGAGGTAPDVGKVIAHPYTAGKLLLLHGTNSNVWESTNYGASWADAGYTHPFSVTLRGNNAWTCGAIPGTSTSYGVVWGLASTGATRSLLWRPPV